LNNARITNDWFITYEDMNIHLPQKIVEGIRSKELGD